MLSPHLHANNKKQEKTGKKTTYLRNKGRFKVLRLVGENTGSSVFASKTCLSDNLLVYWPDFEYELIRGVPKIDSHQNHESHLQRFTINLKCLRID